jgi:hypothetical protein
MFTLPAKPLPLGDAIINTFKLWQATLFSVLPFSIFAAVVNGVPYFVMNSLHDKLLIVVLFLIAALINIIPLTAILARIGHAAHNQPITLSQALAISIIKYPRVLGWLIILCTGMSAAAGLLYLLFHITLVFVLLFLSGVLAFLTLMVYFMCILPIIIFEDLPVVEAIRKSFQLTKNQWWYGAWLLTVIVTLNEILNTAGLYFLGMPGSLLVYCFVLPLQSSMLIVFYEHLKCRASQGIH